MQALARLSSPSRLLWSRIKLIATRARVAAFKLGGRPDAESRVEWQNVRAPLADADVVLQSPTHVWLRDLSRAVHPVQLCRHHPRVANRIAIAWHDPKRTDKLLHDLIFDRRAVRRGFPPRIALEIDRLYRYNAGRLNPLLRAPAPAVVSPLAPVARRVVPAATGTAPQQGLST
jgi:hypothetical protein